MANEDELEGKFENLKGRAKQAVGAATGDKGLEAEGLVERVKGAVKEKVGALKGDKPAPPDEDDES